MGRPTTRTTPPGRRDALRRLFTSRGHTLGTNPKNPYIAFEVRTPGRSIFTLYTSGKLVCTARESDAEGAVLEAAVAELLGEAPAPPGPRAEAPGDVAFLAGADETGTGEVLGSVVLGAALYPAELHADLARLVSHVETKTGRTDAGWERLGDELAALRAQGLVLVGRPVDNRLFDHWSKNALLDLAYLRLLADLLAAAPEDATARGLQCVVDDYGAGPALRGAQRAWDAAGRRLRLETKADREHLAARAASVHARAARAREMAGLRAEVDDGPLGTGNAGHPGTVAWLRRRARTGAPWPSFVKTSFRTVSELGGEAPPAKERVPPLGKLLPEASAAELVGGAANALHRGLLDARGRALRRLRWTPADGLHPAPESAASLALLPLLAGGLVLDEPFADLALLDALLDRERGLAAGWRVLAGPDASPDDPAHRALARAHRSGVVQWEPCAQADPAERAAHHGALLVRAGEQGVTLELPAAP